MNRSESQFCRDEAERLLKLAKETSDQKVRQHLIEMAGEWVARAKIKQITSAKSA
jgi:hypothetical protein